MLDTALFISGWEGAVRMVQMVGAWRWGRWEQSGDCDRGRYRPLVALLCKEIIYDEGADLYNVRFYRQSMNHKTFEVTTKDIEKIEGVYCDMLEEIFTDVTGLYTHFWKDICQVVI